MRIALISFEFAGVEESGGIGTYVRQTAAMLADRGHDVEVFMGEQQQAVQAIPGVKLVPIPGPREDFARKLVDPFSARHLAMPFEVVEGPEFGGDLSEIIQSFPELPRVIKLHTASYQIGQINSKYIGWAAKARFVVGALRRFQMPRPYWGRYDAKTDIERRVTLAADEVTSPSQALLDLASRTWPIDLSRTMVIPNVYCCDPALLVLDAARSTSRVTFIGRLEVRKGVLELARAIPIILDAVPDARFRLVGRTLPHPATREPLDIAVRKLAGPMAATRIEFGGAVPYDDIPEILADTAVGVFPSYWEAYGFVCLEAMAAACGVVGSGAGGMAEIIEDGRTGLLVQPRDPKSIARAVINLLRNPQRRAELGAAARKHVQTTCAPEAIGPLQEAAYLRAISHAKARATNSQNVGTTT